MRMKASGVYRTAKAVSFAERLQPSAGRLSWRVMEEGHEGDQDNHYS
jgi:hypothetical protein